MSLSADLIKNIKAGYYTNSVGTTITYSDVFVELLTYAKDYGYESTIAMTNLKLGYISKRQLELATKIDLLNDDMNKSDYSDKYNIYLTFLQQNATVDAVNMPTMIAANSVLSTRFISFKNLYHELSVLTYKQKLMTSALSNLTTNKDNLDKLIADIDAIS